MKGKAIIIAGTRSFEDYSYFKSKLDFQFNNNQPSLIISGGSNGPDAMAERYSIENHIPFKKIEANWTKGLYAGPERNKRMAEIGEALIAFWDGKSGGTADMIKKAKQHLRPFIIIHYHTDQVTEFQNLNF